MNNSRSIYSTRCWINGKLQPATISINDGKITAVEFLKKDDAENLGNAILMPGVIDAHVHINEPGRSEWEGFDTATKAAAAGGVTTIVDMPLNSSPVTTNLKALQEKIASSKDQLHVNVGLYGGLIPGNKNDLEPMLQAGVLGIKCFLVHSGIDDFPNVGETEVSEAMPIIAKYHVPLLAHCEIFDEPVACGFETHPTSYKHYLQSRPRKWENDAVDLMIRQCRIHNCETHIVHVSSCETLEAISNAKKEGLPLTAETCAHYIYFNAEDIPDSHCVYKCAPPIREKENNDQLKQALKGGLLDFITTDHSPAPPAIKEIESGDLQKAWGGIAGLQFLLPASWTALKETMTVEQFIPLLTEKPAAFLHLSETKGKIATGYDADLIVWNPGESYVAEEKFILHRHKVSPYIGKQLFGVIKETIVNGTTVFRENNIIAGASRIGKLVMHQKTN